MSTLPPPVCFTCGLNVSKYYRLYNELRHRGVAEKDVLQHLPQIRNPCCVTRLITAIDNLDEQSAYFPHERIKAHTLFPEAAAVCASAFLTPDEIALHKSARPSDPGAPDLASVPVLSDDDGDKRAKRSKRRRY